MAAQFLQEKTVADFIQDMLPNFKFVTVQPESTVAEVLDTLAKNSITSAPVYTNKGDFYGIVDVLDLVAYCAYTFSSVSTLAQESYDQMEAFAKKPVSDIMNLSTRNFPASIRVTCSVAELIDLLAQPDLHRLVAVDAAYKGVALITQSSVVEYLYKHRSEVGNSKLQLKAENWVHLDEVKVQLINMNEFVINAFKKIWERRVSGLAVVNDGGELVTNISASDLKRTHPTPIGPLIHELYQPIKQFHWIRTTVREKVLWGDKPRHDPIFIQKTDTLEDAIKQVMEHHIHRVYVVNENKHPVGVVSLSDILTQYKA
jgi:5'-AMP-activated protein kinase regulatory gamma subunit